MRDAEIGDECAPATRLQQHIVRLDVPMHHPLRMGVCESPRDLSQDPRGLGSRKGAPGPNALTQRLAIDIRHCEEHEVLCFIHREDRNDVGV